MAKTKTATKKTAKKKTARKKTNPDRPFDTKSKKGKVTVHIVVAVDADGDTGMYEATSFDSPEDATREASDRVDATSAEFHHFMLEVPIPKPKKLKPTKAKPKAKLEVPREDEDEDGSDEDDDG